MYTYKALAALLTYPSTELQQAVQAGDLQAAIREEGLLDGRMQHKLDSLLRELASWELLDLQERYVELFDRSRSRSLYLFEHVHGESRDRGSAMVELKRMYEDVGLDLDTPELPDFLPLYLEYLSVLEPTEARQRLAQPIHVVSAVGERLRRHGESYAGVFTVLEALCPEKLDKDELEQLLAHGDDDPNDPEHLDKDWEESPVTFGPDAPGTGGNSCGRIKQIAERIAAGQARLQAAQGDDGKRTGTARTGTNG
jgi:nitrate reductase delta subunit